METVDRAGLDTELGFVTGAVHAFRASQRRLEWLPFLLWSPTAGNSMIADLNKKVLLTERH